MQNYSFLKCNEFSYVGRCSAFRCGISNPQSTINESQRSKMKRKILRDCTSSFLTVFAFRILNWSSRLRINWCGETIYEGCNYELIKCTVAQDLQLQQELQYCYREAASTVHHGHVQRSTFDARYDFFYYATPSRRLSGYQAKIQFDGGRREETRDARRPLVGFLCLCLLLNYWCSWSFIIITVSSIRALTMQEIRPCTRRASILVPRPWFFEMGLVFLDRVNERICWVFPCAPSKSDYPFMQGNTSLQLVKLNNICIV